MKNVTVLRNHLFDALNRLAEADNDELDKETQRAASIVQVAECIIKSADTENNFISITRSLGTGFIPEYGPESRQLPKKEKTLTEEIFDVDKEKNWIANG